MKKLFTFITTILIASQMMAQVGEPRRDVAIGVNGGYLLNKVTFDPSIKEDFKGGMTMGFTVRYTCEKYFKMLCALQGEVNISQMGWKEVIETSDDTYQRTMNYVQIPMLVNLGYGKERGGLKGFFVAGPQIGFCISEKEKKGGSWTTKTLSDRSNKVTEQYGKAVEKKFEYGLTGGAGIDISTRSGHHFMLEGRYYFALSDIFKNSKKDYFGRSANSTISIKASYLFDILKTPKEK